MPLDACLWTWMLTVCLYSGPRRSQQHAPAVLRPACPAQVLVMEWIDGIRCTDPDGIKSSGLNVEEFIRCGVVSGLRQLLEFGLFHGDPHPGNIFAVRGLGLRVKPCLALNWAAHVWCARPAHVCVEGCVMSVER